MKDLAAIILAAGKGTRMKSALPKVAHEVAGASMAQWVVRACADAGCSKIVVVVGFGEEQVRSALENDAPPGASIVFATQEAQLGTGHAVLCAALALRDFTGDALVLCGDGPLIRPETLRRLVELRRSSGAAMAMATATLDDPTGYGRIIRNEQGQLESIVEERNATDEQRAVREINPSYYCFEAPILFRTLARIEPDEGTCELYLTAAPAALLQQGARVELMDSVDADEAMSINTPQQLEQAAHVLARRQRAMERSA